MAHTISRDTSIEELLEVFPEASGILMERGIVCVQCGEPVWGTIEEVARKKDMDDTEIEGIVTMLNQRLALKQRGDQSGRY